MKRNAIAPWIVIALLAIAASNDVSSQDLPLAPEYLQRTAISHTRCSGVLGEFARFIRGGGVLDEGFPPLGDAETARVLQDRSDMFAEAASRYLRRWLAVTEPESMDSASVDRWVEETVAAAASEMRSAIESADMRSMSELIRPCNAF